MAYIRQHGSGWRVEVVKHGHRLSRKWPTREEAEAWGKMTEERLGGRKLGLPRVEAGDQPQLMTAVPVSVLRARTQIPYYASQIISSSIPTRMASGVYFLIRGTEVIYVGQSVDVLHRIARHRREKRFFDAFAYIECQVHELDELERLYIKALVPEENWSFGNRGGLMPVEDRRPRKPKPASAAIPDAEELSHSPEPENPPS
jgi:hypothetical protein